MSYQNEAQQVISKRKGAMEFLDDAKASHAKGNFSGKGALKMLYQRLELFPQGSPGLSRIRISAPGSIGWR